MMMMITMRRQSCCPLLERKALRVGDQQRKMVVETRRHLDPLSL